jgi:hypothetical protein
MFTKLYLDTTNPELSLYDIIYQNSYALIVSILFHTIVYVLFVNMCYYIFFGRLLSMKINNRLVIILLVLMTVGYIGRYYHVKDIYNAYNKDMNASRNHLDKLYISWIFIA